MRIVQVYKDYPPVLGGIELHVQDLSRRLGALGQHVTVLTTATGQHSQVDRDGGVHVLRAGRLCQLASTPLSLALPGWARALHADVVHLHMPFPPGDLAARLVPGHPPLVVTYHSDIVRQRQLLRLYAPLMHQTLSRAAAIIATSPQYVATSPWLQAHAARCTVVPFGVDPARFAAPDPARVAALRARLGSPLLLFVGRLRYYKGLHLLIAALARLPGVGLALAGEGPEEHRLRELARAAGLAGRVHFLGEVDVQTHAALLASADLFVLPSHLRAEAFGIAALEALAAGLPVISTELGTGTSYVNQHGETGLVVPPGDVAALARGIAVLLANPALRMHMGANARRRIATHFSAGAMVAAIAAIYARVTREYGARTGAEGQRRNV